VSEREQWAITDRGLWLEWRRRDLTASRISAIFDCHPYLTRDALAATMRGTADAGTSGIPDNPAMRRGRIFEAAVAAAIAEERPHWKLEKATSYHRLIEQRIGCTPDYFVTSDDEAEPGAGLIQIKTCAPYQWDLWQAKPPLVYLLQTLTELLVTGRDWGCLAVMVMSPSYPVHYFAVPRHQAAEERILRAAAAWWAEFDSGRLAPAAEAAGLAEALDDGSSITLDGKLAALLDERELLKVGIKADETRADEIDAALKDAIGRARSGWLPGWQVSYQTQHRKETLIPAKDMRVLRVKRIAEGEEP
jgi:predicted phage-related endonuclease